MGLLYTKMKIFHFPEKLRSLPPEVPQILPPLHIRLKPTNFCNHDCDYCAYRLDNLQLGKDMVIKDFIPKQKMLEIVDDLADMGVKAVTFSGGGEPFCYPYLLETLKALAARGIKFASLTNGSLLKGEVAEVFARHGTWIRISIDGWDDESYSRYRRVPSGEFDKVIDNMARFAQLDGNCYLGVNLVVDRKNVARIYELVARMKEIGVDSVKVGNCIVSNDMNENNEYHQPIFKEAREQVERAAADLAGDEFELFDCYHQLDVRFEKHYSWCPYLQILPVIGADQNVYACHDKAYNLDNGLLGSIKEQRFKELWFSDKSRFFKINPSIHCRHHCMVNAHNELIWDYLHADKGHLEFV